MLNKILIKAALTLSLALSATGFANAALMTQDILNDGNVIGSITIDTTPSTDVGGGYRSVDSFESFSLFGYNLVNPDDALGQFFSADFLGMDLHAGIDFMSFDVNDDWAAEPWAFQGEFVAGIDSNAVDIFDVNTGGFVAFFDQISFGEVSVVPVPATVFLFLAGVAGVATRRRTFK